MPVQLIRKVRDRQPNGCVPPRTAAFVINPAVHALVQKAGNCNAPTQSVIGRGGGEFGVYLKASAATITNRYPCNQFTIGSGNFTAFFVYKVVTALTQSYHYIFGVNISTFAFSPRHTSASYNISMNINGTIVNSGISGSSIGTYKIVVRRKGSDMDFFVNNAIGSTTNSLSIGTISAVCIDSYSTKQAVYGTPEAEVYLAGIETRAWSDDEAVAFIGNPWQIFEPETIPLFFSTVTAQYARPTSDVSAGTWTASTGSDLYAMLDETVANDADYIVTTGASTCEVALNTLSDPASSAGHVVRYRIAADSGGITVRLRQGTTTIATWTHATAPTSLTTYAQTLTSGEADSITDYTALKLQFEAT